MNAMNHIAPAGPVARPYGPPAAGMPVAIGSVGPSAPAARLASPATGGTSHHEWVDQFAGMQLGAGAAGPSTAMHAPAHAAAMNPPMNQHRLPALAPLAMPMFAGGLSYGFPKPGMEMAAQQPQVGLSQDEAAAVDVEAFNRAFDEYDDAKFDAEVADWAEKQKRADAEFIEEQDKWMAEHGPRAESRGGKAQPPTAEEMEVIDANLEKLAKEQDKRRADDDLARAAVDIVNSVADNQSEKFKKSRFFELMRRIGNREVVIEGSNFVNAATGETVDTAPAVPPDDDNNDDSGFGSDKATPIRSNGAA